MATILIVDDNSTIQRVIGMTLRKEGHETFSAGNGLEALEFLSEQQVDLAIVDIAMPEMDGLTLLRHLRQDSQFDTMPILMLTASGQDDDRIRARQEGANGFLSKPAGSWELVETVKNLLGQ
jgi:two-component system, chemotaxis family, chemotaxis protein CheY